VLEVLLEEPDVTATAPGLERVDPVTVESRTFNRFLAQELPEAGVLRIDAPRGGVDARRALVLAILALTVGAMTLVLVRARRRSVPASSAGERRTERLAREIAELDARVEAASHLEPADRDAYARRRADLKRELASALDEERRDG
jgi:hypothetical protein